jgi:hypothetical protein
VNCLIQLQPWELMLIGFDLEFDLCMLGVMPKRGSVKVQQYLSVFGQTP